MAASGRANRQQVAALAGVAPSTVSLVLNGRAAQVGLSEETVARVRAAASELGYRPHPTARALLSGRSRVLALASGAARVDPFAPIFTETLVAMVNDAYRANYQLLLLPDLGAGRLAAVDTAMHNVDIAGALCEGLPQSEDGDVNPGIPVVWYAAQTLPDSDFPPAADAVVIDPRPGMTDLAAVLHEQGHESVSIIVGPNDAGHSNPRLAPIYSRFGDRVELHKAAAWDQNAGETVAGRLLRRRTPPTAIFGGNDLLAAGALGAARALSIDVPNQLTVAGFGDFAVAAQLRPALTTVTWPLRELASSAVNLLLKRIEGAAADPAIEVLISELIRRESC
ncbi:LacI family DNA-binding transcriptional regulator [Kribbella sp. CA-294648]|uniref:LacI family DNA-binding transcriptional regulator n=1 Tax=Kribbella sp. CA-294648 TaxID=3239948 RepID=UPI003D8BE0B6